MSCWRESLGLCRSWAWALGLCHLAGGCQPVLWVVCPTCSSCGCHLTGTSKAPNMCAPCAWGHMDGAASCSFSSSPRARSRWRSWPRCVAFIPVWFFFACDSTPFAGLVGVAGSCHCLRVGCVLAELPGAVGAVAAGWPGAAGWCRRDPQSVPQWSVEVRP